MEKDEHDEHNSTRELDDFIAAERSSNTKGENTSRKCLKGIGEQ